MPGRCYSRASRGMRPQPSRRFVVVRTPPITRSEAGTASDVSMVGAQTWRRVRRSGRVSDSSLAVATSAKRRLWKVMNWSCVRDSSCLNFQTMRSVYRQLALWLESLNQIDNPGPLEIRTELLAVCKSWPSRTRSCNTSIRLTFHEPACKWLQCRRRHSQSPKG